MASQLRSYFCTMLHLYTDSPDNGYKNLDKDVKEDFIKRCERYLTSEDLRTKTVQVKCVESSVILILTINSFTWTESMTTSATLLQDLIKTIGQN